MLESFKKIGVKLGLKRNLEDDKLYKCKEILLKQTVEWNNKKAWRITRNDCKLFRSHVLERKLRNIRRRKIQSENTYPLCARGELRKNLED